MCLCRQKDFRDGRFAQLTSSALDSKLRDDLERLKKIRRACSGPPSYPIRVRRKEQSTCSSQGKLCQIRMFLVSQHVFEAR